MKRDVEKIRSEIKEDQSLIKDIEDQRAKIRYVNF